MNKLLLAAPTLTLLMCAAVLLNIQVFQDVVVFVFLSFLPGLMIFRLLKIRETCLLDVILFSVGLSIAFLMFVGFFLSELHFLGLARPLSTVPLLLVISIFTLVLFFFDQRNSSPKTPNSIGRIFGQPKAFLPLSLLLFLVPVLSIVGTLYVNVSILILTDGIIAVLCVMSAVFRKRIPALFFPLLIFSVSIALLFQVFLTSRYVIGWDANLEYYVFRMTQINGHWTSLDPSINPLTTLTYNSMFSITVLPAVYSVLMNVQGDIIFKLLYPFVFSFVPLTLYRICEKQTGKIVALFAAFFFIFTSTAFFGEPTGLNRQIVGELFFLLSFFVLVSVTIPIPKRRLLLIVFGAALVVSHYALAFVYLAFVSLFFIASRKKPISDSVLNAATVLLLFGITFSWYTFVSSAPLVNLVTAVKLTLSELAKGSLTAYAGSAADMVSFPQVPTAATWINAALSVAANLFIIIGVLVVTLRRKRTGLSTQYGAMCVASAILLAISVIAPAIAAPLNFSRLYGLSLTFLSVCFVLGGQSLLEAIKNTGKRIKMSPEHSPNTGHAQTGGIILLIALLLSAYFLSQSGFINRTTGGAIHSYSLDLDRLMSSSDPQVKTGFYNTRHPDQDVYSAVWLFEHKNETLPVYADFQSGTSVLTSYGLVPAQQIVHITNTTNFGQNSLIYLDTLNIVDGVMPVNIGVFGPFQISALLDESDLVYTNGNSSILSVSLEKLTWIYR